MGPRQLLLGMQGQDFQREEYLLRKPFGCGCFRVPVNISSIGGG